MTHESRPVARLVDYVSLARPDHWTKHVFILPGIVLALVLLGPPASWVTLAWHVVLGLVSACLVASANYVLNETLDAEFDQHHPVKSKRASVTHTMVPWVVWTQYALLAIGGVAIAATVSRLYWIGALVLLISGVIYNVAPIRTKERFILDVVSESVNNPIRLVLGWAMVDGGTLPPSSVVLAYWMGGAFLMAVKRLAEYRTIATAGKLEALERYRRSFRFYTERSLLVSSFVYALTAAFCLAIFLIKYRIEYLIAMPLFVGLFAWYLRMGLLPGSAAEAPEGLFRERGLMLIVAALIVVVAILTWVDVPLLDTLTDPHYVELPWR
ncbi:MAG: UbiA family prenyltransferase [Acidobacteriota bacterium]